MSKFRKMFADPETLGSIAPWFLRLLGASWRFDFVLGDKSPESILAGAPKIFIFWHGRQLAFPILFARKRKELSALPVVVLISKNRDGRIAAKAIEPFGIGSVAGSSSSGGGEALLALGRCLAEGKNVAITPDGPRGPRFELKAGAIKLAQNSGAPIYPIGLSASRAWVFRSWDGMLLPKPFAKISVVVGDPIEIPRVLEPSQFNEARSAVEQRLYEVTDQADRSTGLVINYARSARSERSA